MGNNMKMRMIKSIIVFDFKGISATIDMMTPSFMISQSAKT